MDFVKVTFKLKPMVISIIIIKEMHEFLLDFKRWQMTSTEFKDSMSILKSKEAQCVKLCKNDAKCEKTCQAPRGTVERVMYQKQS